MGRPALDRLVAKEIVMTRFDIIFVLVVISIPLLCSYGTYHVGYSSGYYEKESELKECAAEVSRRCPVVTSYAIDLENENARLNRECRSRQNAEAAD